MSGRFADSRIPLLRALTDLRQTRTPGTIALYGTIGAALAMVSSVPVCGVVQDQFVRAHHARPTSAVTWAAFQLVPKMYSFVHLVWVSQDPLTDEALFDTRPLWLNHYPARATRFETSRAEFVERATDMNVLVRTAYQGRRWISRYLVRADDGGIVIELRE